MKLCAVRIFVMDFWRACDLHGGAPELDERFWNDEVGWAEIDAGGAVHGVERVAPADGDGDRVVSRFMGVSLTVNDIDGTCSRLMGSGVEFKRAPERHIRGGVLAHFLYPDGNELTLLG